MHTDFEILESKHTHINSQFYNKQFFDFKTLFLSSAGKISSFLWERKS